MTDWVILTTAGGKTISLVRALTAAGVTAWTPVEIRQIRKPRSHKRYELHTPIMPRYVFADAARLPDLLGIHADPVSPVPAFHFLKWQDAIRPVPESQLDPIRAMEARTAPKEGPPRFTPGERVRLIGSGYDGITGTVKRQRGWNVDVALDTSPLPHTVHALLLLRENVTNEAKPHSERNAA